MTTTCREELPKGLWQALEAQELVNASTSVASSTSPSTAPTPSRAARTVQEGGFPRRTRRLGRRRRQSSPGYGRWASDPNTPAAGPNTRSAEFVVPGKVQLTELHPFQRPISESWARC